MAEYTATKDSGIEWIGTIPVTWKTHTLYQLVTQVKNKNGDLREDNLLSLSYGKIKRRDINSNGGLLPESFNGYNIIEDGDIVLRLTDLQNDHTSLRVGLATERGIITSAYTTLRPIKKETSRYLYYLLHSFDIKKGFYGMGSGVRQGLNYDEVKELRVILPSDTEQATIVKYLDEQCTKIDDLIEEAKVSIESFKNWKTSLVFEAVTKGINKTVEMKDSGIDIIGQIPKSWGLCRVRFLCSVMTGNQDTQNAVKNGQYPFFVRSPKIERSDTYTFDGEGVLMAGDGAGAGRVFHHAFGKYAIHQRVYCFHSFQNILPDFFCYFMENLFSTEMDKGSAKSTVPSVRLPMLQNFRLCIPPMDEQREIVGYLNENCRIINWCIDEQHTLINNLDAYKKSLIYEVVTGKRKVA